MKMLSTTVALVALAASFSFGQMMDDMKVMYMGVDVHTDGGSWQEVDGRLAQTDASAWLAGAMVPAGIQGKAEYSFDVAYIGGLEDNAIGFGAIVPGFVMGLVWDPANLGGSGLHAQVYNAAGEIHEYAGIQYDFEIPAAMIAGITAEMVMNNPMTVRIRTDFSKGNVWVNDPFDQSTWWALTVDPSADGEHHSMIGVGTTSAAASFGNIRVDENPVFDRSFERFTLPLDVLSLDSVARRQIISIRDGFVTFDKNLEAIAANEDAVSTLNNIGIDLSDLQAVSDVLPTILADATDHDTETLDNVLKAVDGLNSVVSVDIGAALVPVGKQIANLIGLGIEAIRRAASTRRVFVHTLNQDEEPIRNLFVYRAKSENDFAEAVRFSKRSTPTSEERITKERWYFWACDSQHNRVSVRDPIEITPQRGVQEIDLMVGEAEGKCHE